MEKQKILKLSTKQTFHYGIQPYFVSKKKMDCCQIIETSIETDVLFRMTQHEGILQYS